MRIQPVVSFPNSLFLLLGIDCRTALARATGDRTYTLNLLRGLGELAARGELPADWRFQLLLDRPDDAGLLKQLTGADSRFENVILSAPRANSRAWTLFSLPLHARRAHLDLLHVQYLAPLLPCPFVTTIHDTVWRVLPATFPARDRLVMNALLPGTARRAARIITGAHSAKADIARFLPVRKSRIRVVPDSIGPEFDAPISTAHIEAVMRRYGLAGAPYLLSVGVLQPRKNVARLRAAFAQVKRQHPAWPHRLAIVGKVGWGENTQRAAEGEVFTGYVADEELPALYAGATAFCYPSLYEGFGLPVLEAMACGAPVVTSRTASLPEVAGNAALLVEPRSTSSIAQALEQVMGDADLRAELSTKGRARAQTFTPLKQARGTVEVYSSALKAKS